MRLLTPALAPSPPSTARLLPAATAVRMVLAAGGLALIALWTATAITSALAAAAVFDGVFGDGPFQLFNPLRRIAAGQRGGLDFQFFHGLGVPYLHYPLYAAFGKSLASSELSRHLVSYVLFLTATPFVFYAATRRVTAAIGLTAVVLVLVDVLGMQQIAGPGNSLRGVRSACPFALLGVLFLRLPPRWEALIAGFLAGCGFLLGTDQGVAAVLLLGLVWAMRAWAGEPGGRPAWAAVAAGSFAATAGGFLLAVGGVDGAKNALRYALVELPADQFWYFGVPPNPYVRGWRELFADRAFLLPAAAAVGLAAAVRGWVRADPSKADTGRVMLAALAAGAVGSVGYFAIRDDGYLLPLVRVELTVSLVLGWHLLAKWEADPARGPVVGRWWLATHAALLAVFLAGGPTRAVPSSLLYAGRVADAVAFEANKFARPTLSKPVQDHLDALTRAVDADRAGKPGRPSLWSTYAGLAEAHYGVFHPHCDYAIHALGPTRRREYVEAFRRADAEYACTFRRGAHGYEEWLQQTTWGFYEELVLNYAPLARTPAFTVWKRLPQPWRSPDPAAGVSYPPETRDAFAVTPPPGTPAGSPLVVEVEYDVRNAAGVLPVVGKSPRHLVLFADCQTQQPVSLPPYGGRAAFLVEPLAGKTPRCYTTTDSLVGGRVAVTRVTVRTLPPDAAASVTAGLISP